MEPKFELRLINVNWNGKNKISSIQSSKEPIPILYDNTIGFFAETFAYPSIDNNLPAQLALITYEENITPKQILNGNKEIDWILIEDPDTADKYWIENGKWKKFYLDAPSHRHAGILALLIGDQKCIVDIQVPGFTITEFEQILDDFRTGCWELILSDNSPVQVSKESNHSVYSEDFIKYLRNFIKSVERIIELPKNELREKQVIDKYERARPVPRTFMDIALKGKPRTVASRGHIESFNTPENQYIAGIVFRLSILLSNQIKVINGIKIRITLKIQEMQNRINHFSDKFKVDPNKIEFLIQREKKKLELKNILINQLLDSHNHNLTKFDNSIKFKFRITSEPRGGYNETSFFTEVYEFDGKPVQSFNPILSFSEDFFNSKYFSQYDEYLVETDEPDKLSFNKNDKTYHKRIIKYIYSLKLIKSVELDRIRAFEEQIVTLKNNNWERNLTTKEKSQRDKELQSLQAHIAFMQSQSKEWSSIINKILPLLKKIKKIYSHLISLQITPIYHFPGSITFIQNPNYANAKSTYDKLIKESGIDDLELNSLLMIDDYGILDLPKVYELWCLVKMIEIITKQYYFYSNNLKQSFLRIISNRNISNNIELFSASNKLKLEMTYQPKLSNNKTPDYRLILYQQKQKNNEQIFEKLSTLIIDAKFKSYSGQAAIMEELNSLVVKKDYAEKANAEFLNELSNYVYILHPNINIFNSPTTTQDWSSSSFYGGDSLNSDLVTQPDHKIGAILLRPNIEDNFQRLLILLFEYAAEDKTKSAVQVGDIKYDPKPRTIDIKNIICPICASPTSFKTNKIGKNKNGKEYILKCKNPNCATEFIINYCNNCGNRLWKLGSYWTYHDTSPLSPYDIKCPFCGVSNPKNIDIRRDN